MYARQVTRRLHDEHLNAMGLLRRLRAVLSRQGPARPPASGDHDFAALARDLIAAVSGEIGSHFRFEEDELFPMMAARGEGFIGELLAEEHLTILPVGARLAELARQPDMALEAWAEFHRLGGELIERLGAHIEKEETGLMPLVEDLLDDETDARLGEAYALLS
jgi:hemerythrin-like domain-containing protein